MAEQGVDYLARGVADRENTPGLRRVVMGATLALCVLTLPNGEASAISDPTPTEHLSEFNSGGGSNYYEVTGADASPNNGAIMYVHSNGGVAYKASPLSDEPSPRICPPPASKPGETWESISIDKNNRGYWIFSNLGRVSACGVPFYGEIRTPLNGGIVGSAVTATGNGYWFLGKDGGIFSFGDAEFMGSVPGLLGAESLTMDFVDIDATNNGYTIITSIGEQFSFGDAPNFEVPGTNGKTIPEVVPSLNKPIIGQVLTRRGNSVPTGSFAFASDGGVFVSGVKSSNGAAPVAPPVFSGSLGDKVLTNKIVAAVAQPSKAGYWLVDTAGETYAFGEAPNLEEDAPDPDDQQPDLPPLLGGDHSNIPKAANPSIIYRELKPTCVDFGGPSYNNGESIWVAELVMPAQNVAKTTSWLEADPMTTVGSGLTLGGDQVQEDFAKSGFGGVGSGQEFWDSASNALYPQEWERYLDISTPAEERAAYKERLLTFYRHQTVIDRTDPNKPVRVFDRLVYFRCDDNGVPHDFEVLDNLQ